MAAWRGVEATTERDAAGEGVERLAGMGDEMMGLTRKISAASIQSAQRSKDQMDCALASAEIVGETRRIGSVIEAVSEESRVKFIDLRLLLRTCARIGLQRSSLMDTIIEKVMQSEKGFVEVRDSVVEVSRFLGVIRDIGNQSDLLAVNAAIEAARGGAAGGGFRMVAQEMRLLADRTEKACKQIQQLMQSMSLSTNTTSEAIHVAYEACSLHREQGGLVGKAISEAMVSLQQAEDRTIAVADAAKEQKEALARLDQNAQALLRKVEDGASGADALAGTCLKGAERAEHIGSAIECLRKTIRARKEGRGSLNAVAGTDVRRRLRSG